MTRKKFSKKTRTRSSSERVTRNRSVAGRTAAAKGKSFEDQVADLYRLLGARVVQNIEIHQKKVDVLATFRIPGSSREHTVIVECKDETRAVAANQRIMAFKGLLDVARDSGHADSAEIITRVPWSDQAKGFAKSSGVELFTYREKVSQLIDLTDYLKGLVSKFDKFDPARPSEPPLASYYVDLSAQKGGAQTSTHIPVINTYIDNWINNDSEKQLAIFGEYGSGKSTLCQKLARDLADSYLHDAKPGRIPILLNLRDFIGKLDIEAYITSFLDRECHVVNPRNELFRAMNEVGIFVLIFDGFDEMAVKVDADTLETNLLEIEKLAAFKNSKLMLTSRPEYFVNAREESEVLDPTVNPFLIRATQYDHLKILPWIEEQVELFLKKRVPLAKGANQAWTYYRDRIKAIGSLSDLSQRPVLLDMIVKTLPRLISSGETINLPNLYKNYLLGEMKRQKVLKKRSFLLTDEARLELLQELAVQIYNSTTRATTFTEALKLVEKNLAPPKHELEAHTRDFLTNSFLIRKGDDYQLSHKSVLEFLVATRLSKEIESGEPVMFGALLLERQVHNFIREFDPNRQTLLKWVQKTRESAINRGRLGKNASELLIGLSVNSLADQDLCGTNLIGANLYGANLRGCKFNRASLINSTLTSAMFYKKDIKSAKLGGAGISFYLVKTHQTKKYSLDAFMDFAVEILDSMPDEYQRGSLFRTGKRYRPDIFWEISIPVKNQVDLEALRDQLSRAFKTSVAVFADDLENLANKADLKRRSD